MISAARSELSGLIIRAAVGRGLPIGVADELSAAAIALCAAGQDGAKLALQALETAPKPAKFSDGVLVGESLPILAPSAFDLAETGSVKLRTSADVALLDGYAMARGGGWTVSGTGPNYVLEKSTSSAMPGNTPPPYAVAREVWDGLVELGVGALVPATPETSAGAGAGQIDND